MSISESFWLKWHVSMCPIADRSATTSTVMYILYMAVTGSVQGVCLSFCTERRKLRIREDHKREMSVGLLPTVRRVSDTPTVCARPK